MVDLYFVKIEPESTNMRTRAEGKVGGVLTPGPHRDWRHWTHYINTKSYRGCVVYMPFPY